MFFSTGSERYLSSSSSWTSRLERRLGGLLDVHRRHGQVKKGARRSMLEVVCGRALAAPASRRSAAASTADGSDVRKPAASRGPGACTVLYRYRRISGYPTIRDIRRLFHGIWIYLEHPHQLSVSTRWQNGHYPVNPDCAGANRIHSLAPTTAPPRTSTHSDGRSLRRPRCMHS